MAQQTPYQVLGVAQQAGPEEIRRRYRELAKQYHPDVRRDKRRAHEQFVRIAEAYRVLIDPATRAELDEQLRRAHRRRAPFAPVLSPLERARLRLADGELDEALLLCSEALDRTSEDAEVHRLLARIYRARGNARLAARAEQRAARLAGHDAPTRPRQAPPPAAEAHRAAAERARAIAREVPPPTALRRAVLAAGWALVCALAVLTWALPPRPPLLGLSVALLAIGLGGPFVLGAVVGGSGLLGSFDDELAGASLSAPHGARLPVGLVLAVCALLWAPLALAAAAAIGLLAERFPRGPAILLGASLLWSGNVLGAAVVQELAWWRVVMPGLGLWNFAAVSALGGWAVAAAFRPRLWE